jgi:hypothetical protein
VIWEISISWKPWIFLGIFPVDGSFGRKFQRRTAGKKFGEGMHI